MFWFSPHLGLSWSQAVCPNRIQVLHINRGCTAVSCMVLCLCNIRHLQREGWLLKQERAVLHHFQAAIHSSCHQELGDLEEKRCLVLRISLPSTLRLCSLSRWCPRAQLGEAPRFGYPKQQVALCLFTESEWWWVLEIESSSSAEAGLPGERHTRTHLCKGLECLQRWTLQHLFFSFLML